MEEIIQAIKIQLQKKVETHSTYRMIVGKPSSPTKIEGLEKKVNFNFPKDYAEFLQINDGLRLVDGSESIFFNLHASSKIPLRVDQNLKETLGEDSVDLSQILIIGQVPIHNVYVYFDKRTNEVIKWAHFNSTHFSDFATFLNAEVEFLRNC